MNRPNSMPASPGCPAPVDAASPEIAEGTVSENVRECPILEKKCDAVSDKQRVAIELLLAGKRLATVAERAGIDARTLYRWRHDESFLAELDRRRHELWDGAAERMRALVHPAIDVLEEEVHDVYDRSRMRAVGMILRFADLRKSVPPRKRELADAAGE